jgi:tripartite-type tricarboxylate transporter receptor subunit TctC
MTTCDNAPHAQPPGASPKTIRVTAAAASVLAALTFPAHGQAAGQSTEQFFKSTQLTMIVGSGAGGGYDVLGRLVAQYLTKYLPGNPNMVVKNMPSASGVQAANYMFNTAPHDGSTISAATNAALMLPFYNTHVAHYDPRKFEWIGSVFKQQALCVSWYTTKIKTLKDAMAQETTVAATGVSAGPGVFPKILNEMIGTKFKVISGYTTNSMRLAMEKGEVDGVCGLAWQTYKTVSRDWIAKKKLNILAQIGVEKHPELPDVPNVLDMIKNPDDKKVLELIVTPQEFGRPYIAPAGVPADRMAAYRKAFEAMLKDKQFVADLAKQGGTPEPMTAEAITALLAKAYAAPQALRERAAKLAGQL